MAILSALSDVKSKTKILCTVRSIRFESELKTFKLSNFLQLYDFLGIVKMALYAYPK